MTPGPGSVAIACALSAHAEPIRAIDQVCDAASATLAGRTPDVVSMFFAGPHVQAAKAMAYVVRRRLGPRVLIGVSAEAVIAGDVELEGQGGISLFAACLPGVTVHPFRLDQLPAPKPGSEIDSAAMAAAAGMLGHGQHRATFLFADPFSVAMNALLPALDRARIAAAPHGVTPGTMIGGLASASPRAGGNALILDDEVLNAGAVGVSLSGPVRVDTIVSQGCRPFGQTMVVTGVRGQIVTSLGGRPALEVLQSMIEELDEASRELLKKGVFLGRVVNEYKDRFGRGDFLVRNVIGGEEKTGSIAVADLLRVGQTVQFHLRDAATADEDLALLLDGQKLHGPPAGAMLFTCNGRGKRLFGEPNHDAGAVARAFALPEPGEQLAKAGRTIAPAAAAGDPGALPGVPLAGFFAAGEIGPVGTGVFLHGQTAALALFRDPNRDEI
jgi:small ligand-binding sensory domain FIST